MNEKYIRIFFLIIVVIICRYIYSINESDFCNYISYIFAIGLLLIILVPELDEFSFWGIKAKGKSYYPGSVEELIIHDKEETLTGDSRHE